MSQFDIELGDFSLGTWRDRLATGDLTVAKLTKAARERAQRAIDEATLTVNLPVIELPTSVTLGTGGVEAPPPVTSGNGTAGILGTGNTLLLVGAAVALFVFMRK